MKMIKLRAAKKSRHLPPKSRRGYPVLAARPGNCVFVLVRQMSCSACSPAPSRKKRSEQTIYDAATRELLQIDFPARESDFGWRIVVARQCDLARSVERMREGNDGEGVHACSRGGYFRRNSSEIPSETERNTSTANTPIIPKPIIRFLRSRPSSLRNSTRRASHGAGYLSYFQHESRRNKTRRA
jgi:hypothetical protein